MKLQVTVLAGSDRSTFFLSAGDGSNTIKWLGLASAHRYYRLTGKRARKVSRLQERCLPKRVFSATVPLFPPEDSISDHLQEEGEVFVELMDSVPVDVVSGKPVLGGWARSAFQVAEHTALQGKAAFDEEYKKIEEQADRREDRERQRKEMALRAKFDFMREVLHSQLADDRKVEAEFMLDLPVLEDSVYVRHLDPEALRELEQLIRDNYVSILDCLRDLAAGNKDIATIEEAEFLHFAKTSSLFEGIASKPSDDKFSSIFQSLATRGDRGSKGVMHRSQFIVALVRLAQLRFIETMSSSSSSSSISSLPEAVELLFDTVISRWVREHALGADIDRYYSSVPLMALLFDAHPDLASVFHDYAARDGDGDKVMNLREFDLLMEDANIYWSREETSGGKEEEDETKEEAEERKERERLESLGATFLSHDDIRSAFSTSQSEFNYGASLLLTEHRESSSHHLEEMTYPEFLESLIRISARLWQNSSLSTHKQLDETIKMVLTNLRN